MFKPKQKQSNKHKSSKSLSYNSIDSYFQKTKSSHFQIYLNSVGSEYDLENIYATTVTIERCEDFLDSLVKGFSSVYQMDHKSFDWKDKVEGLVKIGKEVVKVIDKVKQEVKALEDKRVSLEDLEMQLSKITQQHNQLKQKYDQLQERSLADNLKLQMHIKSIERLDNLEQKQVVINQKENQLVKKKNQNEALCKQNLGLREKINNLTQQNYQLNAYLNKIIRSSFCPNVITQITQKITSANTTNKNKTNSQSQENSSQYPQSTFQSLILLNPTLSSTLCSFLPPKSLTSLFSLAKTSRFFLLHNPRVIHSSFRSIINYKQYQISFFHRYINHFQKKMKKIPQEVVQMTFYQFNILKENVGGDFMAVLNLCANIFEGKFTQHTINVMNKTVKEYLQSKEILHFVQEPKEQELFLRIDKNLVQHFFQERKGKKQQVMKQIQQMTHKISQAQNLYSVDSQTLNQFNQTIVRHFTILFVLAKHLFSQSRSLQYLNGFLLSELNGITKFKIQKQYDLQDIKAQLQASNKMCLFLSDKCNKSEERILRQTKEYLDTQRHVGKLAQFIKAEQEKVKNLENLLGNKEIQIDRLKHKYSQLKAAYMASRQKYNRLVNQLATLKQTIININ